MGLIRLIIFALVIWMFWRLVKNFKAKLESRNNSDSQSGNKLEQGNMVPCDFCSVHIPEEEAIQHEKMWFCNNSHKEKYLEDNS